MPAMKIDWTAKLRHMLQVWVFALLIAALQWAFMPDRPYGPPLAYSFFISTFTWAIVDLGRGLFPSAQETGWPRGLAGLALVLGGIVVGYVLGTWMADLLCVRLGWYPPGTPALGKNHLRHSILITAMAGVIGSYYFYSLNRSDYLLRKMGESQRLANETRLKLLEAQLEPHMLFNTLANLRALIGTDPPRAQRMLDHMIAYLRATLDASRSPGHTLADEFERLRDYLELMAIRMGPRLAYTLELPPELATQPVPALLLQPLVDNAIKHGLEPQIAGGRISVRARRESGAVVLEVVDTGAGASAQAVAASGFGLTQVRERLATLYGAAGELQLGTGAPQGTRVQVRYPAATA